jgi:hypothetical protein
LTALKELANHFGVVFMFFGLGFRVFPNGLGLMPPLSEPQQQASQFIEGSDSGLERPF